MRDKSDLERLYDEHANALFAFLLNFTRDEQDTRDVLQEIFIRIAREPGLLRGARDERAFLLRMARNAAIDLMRRRGARERRQDEFATEAVSIFEPSAGADEETFAGALDEVLSELPPEQREVVHLKLWEQMTFEKIARTLGIPLNTAASRYRYGIDKLRERLRPLYEEMKKAEG